MLPLSLYAIVYVYMDCVYGRYIIIIYHMIHLCSRKNMSCQLPKLSLPIKPHTCNYKNGKPVRSYWMVLTHIHAYTPKFTCQMLIIFDHFEHVNQACRTARWE